MIRRLVLDASAAMRLVLREPEKAVTHDHPVDDLLYAVLARRTASAVLTRDRRLATLLGTLGILTAG